MGQVFNAVPAPLQALANPLGATSAGGLGNQIGQLGGITNGIAQGFTPQNQFQAGTPLDVANLQSQVYAGQKGLAGTQDQQQALAAALLAQSQGQGPNPAQQQLQNATQANAKQAAGQIASQKGINPAQAARAATQNAAMVNQQAAGQGAALQAQQQLGAQQGLGNVYGQLANENLQNAQTSGSLANNSSLGAQQINAGTSAQNAAATQSTASGLLSGLGGAAAALAHGGMVPKMADGGKVASSNIANQMLQQAGVQVYGNGMDLSGGKMKMPKMGGGDGFEGDGTAMAGGAGDAGGAGMAAAAVANKGGRIPPHLEQVAKIYHPNFQHKGTEELKADGGHVPGKAKVSGDSLKNDTVPTMLSPGEMVIPRSVMNEEDPAEAAKQFVMKKLGEKVDTKKDDFREALKGAIRNRKA